MVLRCVRVIEHLCLSVSVYLCGLLASPAFIWLRGFMMGTTDWMDPLSQTDGLLPDSQTVPSAENFISHNPPLSSTSLV